jgi:glutathione S-transferase
MRLLEFPHSHYCEKARWALDYKGVPFRAVAVMPGFHVVTVRRYAPDTAVPVLLDGRQVVQGSGAIIDYLDEQHPEQPLTPADARERAECLDIEAAMDDRLGENLRRILYHWLLAYPDFIRYCFTYPMPAYKRALVAVIYPALRRKIYQTYVISPAKVERSLRAFERALAEVGQRLDGKRYVVGERFTRADLSVAAMLSLLVMPPEHPFPWIPIPDSAARAFYDAYRDHPVCEWVREMYRMHRRAVTTAVHPAGVLQGA